MRPETYPPVPSILIIAAGFCAPSRQSHLENFKDSASSASVLSRTRTRTGTNTSYSSEHFGPCLKNEIGKFGKAPQLPAGPWNSSFWIVLI